MPFFPAQIYLLMIVCKFDHKLQLLLDISAPLPPLPEKLTPLHRDHFTTRGLDGAIQCVVTARP
jgi:hypothetical protein